MMITTDNFLNRINIPTFSFKVPLFCCACKTETICTVSKNTDQFSQLRTIFCDCGAKAGPLSMKVGSGSGLPGKDLDTYILCLSNNYIIMKYDYQKREIKKILSAKTLPEAYFGMQNYFLL